MEDRTLNPGEKLPSTRQLADKLGLHRSTIALVYQELWSLGYIDLFPGANHRVRDRRQIVTAALVRQWALSVPFGLRYRVRGKLTLASISLRTTAATICRFSCRAAFKQRRPRACVRLWRIPPFSTSATGEGCITICIEHSPGFRLYSIRGDRHSDRIQ
jgi:DNA-binding transcriptional MocR family regulator